MKLLCMRSLNCTLPDNHPPPCLPYAQPTVLSPQCPHVDAAKGRCTLASGHPVGPMFNSFSDSGHMYAGQCDGNHAVPACGAAGCWQLDPPPATHAATSAWTCPCGVKGAGFTEWAAHERASPKCGELSRREQARDHLHIDMRGDPPVFPEESKYWTDDADGDPVLVGEVGPPAAVTLPEGVSQALTVGPDEVLVIAFEQHIAPHERDQIRRDLERTIPGDRFVIVAGRGARIGKVHSGPVQTDRGVIDDGVLRPPLPPA
jgi:hypothetical protein